MKGGQAMYKASPQVFHDKEDKPTHFVMYPTDLIIAINNLCSGNEAKVLLALLGFKGDGSFCANTQYMLKATGISKQQNFSSVRKILTDKGYIEEQDGDIYIDTAKIIKEYKEKDEPDDEL